jgi:prepilin-type N-terminal cleavage/methylation domain-containing protein
MTWRKNLARGFTLIEIAIVMVVIGLVLSGGLMAVAPVLETSKISDTNAKMDRIEQALILHVIRYGCLPCPADSSIASGAASVGQAFGAAYYSSACTTACDASVDATAAAQGIVPWVNLGLSEADVTDGFGYRIDYAVAPLLAQSNTMVRTPPATYPVGVLAVQTTAASGGSTTTSTAAYVLISHGNDHALAFGRAGGAVRTVDPHGSAAQTQNSNGSPFVQDVQYLGTNATYFDDIVRFRTAPMIIQLCGANACGNPA